LEGLNEVEKERLAGVKEATATNSVPLVPVQSKKQLAEWVGVRGSHLFHALMHSILTMLQLVH
jgi:ribosomal protein L7Ae-like RNA K-turn-binding protein